MFGPVGTGKAEASDAGMGFTKLGVTGTLKLMKKGAL